MAIGECCVPDPRLPQLHRLGAAATSLTCRPISSWGPKEKLFAVFMRVENTSDKPSSATNAPFVSGHQGNIYRPIGPPGRRTSSFTARLFLQPKDTSRSPAAPRRAQHYPGATLPFKIRSPTSRAARGSFRTAAPTSGPTGPVLLDV